MNQEPFTWNGYDAKSDAHRTLHGFLVLDVQYSSRHAEEILAEISAYLNGDTEEVSGSGNGYEYECHKDGLYLESLYDDPDTPITVGYETALQALREWADYCRELEARS